MLLIRLLQLYCSFCVHPFFVAGALLCHIIILPDRAKHINPFGKGRIEKNVKRDYLRERERESQKNHALGRCHRIPLSQSGPSLKGMGEKMIFEKLYENDNRCSFYRKRRPTHYAPFQHYRSKNQHHQLSSRIKRVRWWWWRIVQVENSMSKQKSKLKTKSTGQFWSIDARQSYRGEVSKNQDNAEC